MVNRLDITPRSIKSGRPNGFIPIVEDNDPDALARMERQLRWERRQSAFSSRLARSRSKPSWEDAMRAVDLRLQVITTV
jgi:hypothetical protein